MAFGRRSVERGLDPADHVAEEDRSLFDGVFADDVDDGLEPEGAFEVAGRRESAIGRGRDDVLHGLLGAKLVTVARSGARKKSRALMRSSQSVSAKISSSVLAVTFFTIPSR